MWNFFLAKKDLFLKKKKSSVSYPTPDPLFRNMALELEFL